MRGAIRKRSKDSWQIIFDLPREADGRRRQARQTVRGNKKKAEAKEEVAEAKDKKAETKGEKAPTKVEQKAAPKKEKSECKKKTLPIYWTRTANWKTQINQLVQLGRNHQRLLFPKQAIYPKIRTF